MNTKISYYVPYNTAYGKVTFGAKATPNRTHALNELADMTRIAAERLELVIEHADTFGIIEIVVDLSDVVELLS